MRITKLAFTICTLITLASCGSSHDDAGHMLSVSIEPQRQILEQLAGPAFEVTTVLGRGADPETFDPSTAQRMAIDHADIYFATGVLPFEEKLRRSLDDGCLYVDTSEGVELLHGTHGAAHSDHHHDDADPHYWSSVRNMRRMAASMAKALTERYPDSSAVINRRLEAFNATADSLDRAIQTKTSQTNRRSFAVWHPSLSYFANDYGMRQLSFGVEGKEMSVKEMANAITRAKADSIAVFFFQPSIDSRQANVLCDNIGARLVAIDPLAYDWQEQLTTIADELSRQ